MFTETPTSLTLDKLHKRNTSMTTHLLTTHLLTTHLANCQVKFYTIKTIGWSHMFAVLKNCFVSNSTPQSICWVSATASCSFNLDYCRGALATMHFPQHNVMRKRIFLDCKITRPPHDILQEPGLEAFLLLCRKYVQTSFCESLFLQTCGQMGCFSVTTGRSRENNEGKNHRLKYVKS